MRRIGIVAIVALLVGVLQTPASAGGTSPHLRVRNNVDQGSTLRIKVLGCEDGDGWQAAIEVYIFDDTGEPYFAREYVPDEDGVTVIRKRIRAGRYPVGKYSAKVICRHDFDAGGSGTFFDEEESFNVTEP